MYLETKNTTKMASNNATKRVKHLPFIGRQQDIEIVTEALKVTMRAYEGDDSQFADPFTNLVLVCGGASVGKSRFGAEAAQELQKWSKENGIHLCVHSVELGGLDNPHQVEMKMASALLPWQHVGLRHSIGEGLGELKDWHLFILDGAEGFGGNDQQSGFMELCQEVIEGFSRVLIIITSQWKFNFIRIMNKVLTVHLYPLPPDQSKQLLFSMAPSLEDSGIHQSLIDDIIELCGGIPYVLELVGAGLREEGLDPTDVLNSLCQDGYENSKIGAQTTRVDVDEGSFRADVGNLSRRVRLRLEQLMAGGVNRLSCPLRKRLAQLSFIPSSFTDEAASFITNINPLHRTKRDLLIPLHNRSLVAMDTLTNRFNIHSFMRLFVEERYSLFLSPSETDLVRVRYCGFYARLLQRAAELLEQDNALKSIPIFTVELQNMQKLLQEAIHCFEDSYDLFIEVAYQARQLILQFIPSKDAISFYQACLEAAEKRKDKQRQARILISLGLLVRYVDGDMKYAEDLYRQALNLLAQDGDSLDHAAILSVLGFHFFDSARPKLAISYQEETLEMIERLEKEMRSDERCELKENSGKDTLSPRMQLWRLKAQTLQEMACVHARLDGNSQEGIACHEESIEIQKRLWKDHLSIGENYHCMAAVYHNMGCYEQALQCISHALDIIERLCTQPCTTLFICYAYAAVLQFDCKGDLPKAMHYIQKCWQIQHRLKTKNILEFCLLYDEAKIVARTSNIEKARQMFKKGFSLAMPILGEHLNTARALQSEGWAALRVGDHDDALETLQRCLEMRQRVLKNMKWNVEIAETLETMGDAYAAKNKHQMAVDYYERCYDALSVPLRCYRRMGSSASQKVAALRDTISRKKGIVSRDQAALSQEEISLMNQTVVYDYNYWPMT